MRIDRFEKEAVLVSMKDMLQSGHFSICEVDKCLDITGTTPNQRVYRALSAVHCVSWKDMSPAFRRAVCEKTISLFPSLDVTALNMGFNEKGKVLKFQKKKADIKLLPMPVKGGAS